MGGRKTREAHRAEYDLLREALVHARESAGLSQRELSGKLGRAVTFVSKVERGVQHLDLVELVDWALLLGLDAVALVRILLPDAIDKPASKTPPR